MLLVVDQLGLCLLGLETALLEVDQHDDVVITQIPIERMGHPGEVKRVAVLVLLAIGDGGQIVRNLGVLFLGSGALDRDGVLGRENHDREIDHLGLGLSGRDDGARLDDSVSVGRFALLEELLGREGLDDATTTVVAKCRRRSRRRRVRGASGSCGRTEKEELLLLLL